MGAQKISLKRYEIETGEDVYKRQQFLQRLGNLIVVQVQLTLGIDCHCVCSYYHSHSKYLHVLCQERSFSPFDDLKIYFHTDKRNSYAEAPPV